MKDPESNDSKHALNVTDVLCLQAYNFDLGVSHPTILTLAHVSLV